MRRVAVILAGLFRGSLDSSLELQRAVIAPLLRVGWQVDVYGAGAESDRQQWLDWFHKEGPVNTTGVGWFFVPTKTEDEIKAAPSYFTTCSDDHYRHAWSHLATAWEAALASNFSYDYAIKTRNDVHYHPAQFVKPCWLASLADDVILNNDLELNQGNRWNERGWIISERGQAQSMPKKQSWEARQTSPMMLSDQLLIGTARTMGRVLTLNAQPPTRQREDCGNDFIKWLGLSSGGIEAILGDYLYRNHIGVFTVSLQLGRTPNIPKLKSPCRLCYDCVSADPYAS